MLICMTDDGITLGRLIDLDNSKIVTAHRWPIIVEFATSLDLAVDFNPNIDPKPHQKRMQLVNMAFELAEHPVSEVFANWAAQNKIFDAWEYLRALKLANPTIKETSPVRYNISRHAPHTYIRHVAFGCRCRIHSRERQGMIIAPRKYDTHKNITTEGTQV